jgi:hypothetical protein
MSKPSDTDTEDARPSLWARTIADEAFRDALVYDPLRALARFQDVDVSPDQIRQLEEMTVDERRELIQRVVREAHLKGGAARFGDIGFGEMRETE